MVKLKKEDLKNVNGGYVSIKKNFDTNEVWASVHDDHTDEVLISRQLLGVQASDSSIPLDSETIALLRRIDESYNTNMLLLP